MIVRRAFFALLVVVFSASCYEDYKPPEGLGNTGGGAGGGGQGLGGGKPLYAALLEFIHMDASAIQSADCHSDIDFDDLRLAEWEARAQALTKSIESMAEVVTVKKTLMTSVTCPFGVDNWQEILASQAATEWADKLLLGPQDGPVMHIKAIFWDGFESPWSSPDPSILQVDWSNVILLKNQGWKASTGHFFVLSNAHWTLSRWHAGVADRSFRGTGFDSFGPLPEDQQQVQTQIQLDNRGFLQKMGEWL